DPDRIGRRIIHERVVVREKDSAFEDFGNSENKRAFGRARPRGGVSVHVIPLTRDVTGGGGSRVRATPSRAHSVSRSTKKQVQTCRRTRWISRQRFYLTHYEAITTSNLLE